jgi:YVTN family beta-propeller protein
LGTALVGAASLLAVAPARTEAYRDYRRTIFVARRGVAALDAIDVDSDAVTGTLELGLEPRELQISQRGGRLAAIDLRSPRLVSVDLATQSRRDVPLPFIPSRLRISPDGQRLAAFDDVRGTIVLLDSTDDRERSRIDGPREIREAIFSGDSSSLLVAAASVGGLSTYDIATAQPVPPVEGPSLQALLRAPNGREGFALTAETPRRVLHLDLRSRQVLASVPTSDHPVLFATGTGIQLLAIDQHAGTLSILPSEPLQPGGVVLPAAASTAYAAWFDTVAFVPAPATRKLLIFDLERRKAAGSIALDGVPGTGVVTPDGDKLYLPIEDQGTVAVIDTHVRQRTASISIGAAPVQAIIAGGYGLCH